MSFTQLLRDLEVAIVDLERIKDRADEIELDEEPLRTGIREVTNALSDLQQGIDEAALHEEEEDESEEEDEEDEDEEEDEADEDE